MRYPTLLAATLTLALGAAPARATVAVSVRGPAAWTPPFAGVSPSMLGGMQDMFRTEVGEYFLRQNQSLGALLRLDADSGFDRRAAGALAAELPEGFEEGLYRALRSRDPDAREDQIAALMREISAAQAEAAPKVEKAVAERARELADAVESGRLDAAGFQAAVRELNQFAFYGSGARQAAAALTRVAREARGRKAMVTAGLMADILRRIAQVTESGAIAQLVLDLDGGRLVLLALPSRGRATAGTAGALAAPQPMRARLLDNGYVEIASDRPREELIPAISVAAMARTRDGVSPSALREGAIWAGGVRGTDLLGVTISERGIRIYESGGKILFDGLVFAQINGMTDAKAGVKEILQTVFERLGGQGTVEIEDFGGFPSIPAPSAAASAIPDDSRPAKAAAVLTAAMGLGWNSILALSTGHGAVGLALSVAAIAATGLGIAWLFLGDAFWRLPVMMLLSAAVGLVFAFLPIGTMVVLTIGLALGLSAWGWISVLRNLRNDGYFEAASRMK